MLHVWCVFFLVNYKCCVLYIKGDLMLFSELIKNVYTAANVVMIDRADGEI